MATKTISTITAATPITGATMLLLSLNPVKIFNIEGNVNSTTGTSYYIQLLGTAAPVSGTTVPLYSRLCVPSAAGSGINGFSFTYNPEGIDTARMSYPEATAAGGDNTLPVYVAISSTDNVWTSVAASTDVSVDIEQSFVEPANETIVNLAGPAASLAVWTDGNTMNRLTAFNFTNNNGVDVYLGLFAYTAPPNGTVPMQQWKVLSGATLKQTFGNTGIIVQQSNASYVQKTGCYFYPSTSPLFTTFTTFGATTTLAVKYVALT